MRADLSRCLIRFFSFFGNLAGSLFIVWIVDETLLFQSGMPAGAPNTLPCACTRSEIVMIYHNYTLILPERQGESAEKLQAKAAKFLPFIGLARSKRGLINRGHGANSYRPPPAGDLKLTAICCKKTHKQQMHSGRQAGREGSPQIACIFARRFLLLSQHPICIRPRSPPAFLCIPLRKDFADQQST